MAWFQYHHFDGPIPGLEMFRDLPRRKGQFYFLLCWTDREGKLDERQIARPVSREDLIWARDLFNKRLGEIHASESERVGFAIDVEEFSSKEIPALAERTVNLLCAAKTQDDFKIDTLAGLMGFSFGCWIVLQPEAQNHLNFDTLLTLAVALTFDGDGFLPIVAADHGNKVEIVVN